MTIQGLTKISFIKLVHCKENMPVITSSSGGVAVNKDSQIELWLCEY